MRMTVMWRLLQVVVSSGNVVVVAVAGAVDYLLLLDFLNY